MNSNAAFATVPQFEESSSQKFSVRLALPHELEEVYRLRYRVFFEELGATSAVSDMLKMDVDSFDRYCDHLVVTYFGKIVGTYRLLPLKRLGSQGVPCYSQSEFDVSSLRESLNDNVLELGRTCVEPEFRNGTIATLLWSGVTEYLRTVHVKALFGCVSLHNLSHVEALQISSHFKTIGKWHSTIRTSVCENFRIPSEQLETHIAAPGTNVIAKIPSLLNGYFNLGGKICGGPAYDAEFHCHDFLIMLETENFSPKHLKFLSRIGHLSQRSKDASMVSG